MPVLLLLLFSLALSIGTGIVVLVIRRAKLGKDVPPERPTPSASFKGIAACILQRPTCWLTVKSRSLIAVQSALGLSNPKPCSWVDGLVGEQNLFIAPPVKGWILITGAGLPDPDEDVDACFRFIVTLSRRLGQVQYFVASRVLQHHAWISADAGRIVRAYAWAGRTLWQQGKLTSTEKELGLKSFGYNESPERHFGKPDVLATNTDKVPLLAARWSLDPGHIDDQRMYSQCGIAGELSRRY